MVSLDQMSPSTNVTEGMLLETYFEVIPFDIYVVDVHTFELVYANRLMRQHLPASMDRAQPCHLLLYQEPAPCRFCKIRQLVDEHGLPSMQTHVYEMYDEPRERWLQLHEKAITWPDGRTMKYTIAVDISELKAMQNRLAEAHARMALMNKELQAQNQLLQEHLRLREDVERMTRHDLKSPLTPILNFPQMILEDHPELPPRTVEALECIATAGSKILNLVSKTLDLLRLEQGTYVLRPEPLNVLALLRSALRDLDPLLRQRGATCVLQHAGQPAEKGACLLVAAEELLCYSLFSNLLKNAAEASPSGAEVVVDVTQEPGMACVRVENQGEVPAVVRQRFFEKYATASKDGTGLGTYVAKLIAEVHGGAVVLDTAQPGRTSVLVRLPLAGPA
ncbi:PAS domain-containing sensor histidine kinase [Megalodesulfovibrio gigas]|uniref:histidine kinase n=1 Tax=Megalodesulfovibrio gigas (strain ATCC 19364 / DSM 1382 / NCIMB 9332 / VKM B-1759) TaxID=1121448 RepID=T2G869_MEGG1|nr:HAMP domain-containing sensor histidine kinase [Megalodesulfovibrio gigas]AGW12483.1 putative PAS/PAC sensor signal transduction histidine kinase [Megalodesulfovibrio gigas DSM 1382 = ATCC 19364]